MTNKQSLEQELENTIKDMQIALDDPSVVTCGDFENAIGKYKKFGKYLYTYIQSFSEGELAFKVFELCQDGKIYNYTSSGRKPTKEDKKIAKYYCSEGEGVC